MTDRSNPRDQAERIRALQERRASVAASPRGGKRKHAAEASRVVVAGLSVASFMAIGAGVALAHRGAASTTATAAPTAAQVIVRRVAAPTAAQPVAQQAVAQQAVAQLPVVHTKTHGS